MAALPYTAGGSCFAGGSAVALALYLHIPFCARKCAYCDFASWATPAGDPLMGAYARALGEQLEEAASLGLLEGCETAYVGGGTPTLLGEMDLGRLVEKVVAWPPPPSSPARPIQTRSPTRCFSPYARRGRRGSPSASRASTTGSSRARAPARRRVRPGARRGRRGEGLDVSVDLMCATPGQTPESWARSLEGAVALGVGHVSVYPLQIEEGTPLDRRFADDPCAWNDPEVQAERMTEAQVALEARWLPPLRGRELRARR